MSGKDMRAGSRTKNELQKLSEVAQDYEIRVKGHLDSNWAEWFEGLSIRHQPNGETILSGQLLDQAALHGVLIKIRDLGLTLISVSRIET